MTIPRLAWGPTPAPTPSYDRDNEAAYRAGIDRLLRALIPAVQSVVSTPATIFNVKDYGAVGDGVTDDYAAIGATLTAAAVEGGRVYFPRGIYAVDSASLGSSGFAVGSNVGLLGDGSDISVITVTGVTACALFVYTAQQQNTVQSLGFVGNNVTTASFDKRGTAIFFDDTTATSALSGYLVEDCAFSNFAGRVWVWWQHAGSYGLSNIMGRRNTFSGGSDYDPTDIGSTAAQMGCVFNSNANVSDVWFLDNDHDATEVKNGITCVTSSGTGQWVRVTYRGNKVRNAGQGYGAGVEGAYGLILYGQGRDCDIMANTCERCYTVGIYVNIGRNARIIGNSCSGTEETNDASLPRGGIAVNDGMRVVVSGNVLFDNALCGIQLNAGIGHEPVGTVSDNIISWGQYGIILRAHAGGGGWVIADNTIGCVTDFGILTGRAAPGTYEMANLTLTGNTIYTPRLLSIGSNDKKVAVGTFYYVLDHVRYVLSENLVGVALSAGTIPADQAGCYLFSVDDAQNVTCTPAADNFTTGYATVSAAYAARPSTPAGEQALGYVVVVTASGQPFIGGTDSLAGGASGNVASVTNYFGGFRTNGIGEGNNQVYRNLKVGNNTLYLDGPFGLLFAGTVERGSLTDNIVEGAVTYGLSLAGGSTFTGMKVNGNTFANCGLDDGVGNTGNTRVALDAEGDFDGNVSIVSDGLGVGTVAGTRHCTTSTRQLLPTADRVLSMGSNNTRVANTALTFVLGVTNYTIAADPVGFALAAGTVPMNQWAGYLFSTTSAGVRTCTPAANNFTAGYATFQDAVDAKPSTPANELALGYVVLQTAVGQPFVGGTDALFGGTGGNPANATSFLGGFPTLTQADHNCVIDATLGEVYVRLPLAADVPGKRYTLFRVDSTMNQVQVARQSADLVSNQAYFLLGQQNQSLDVVSDGDNVWQVIASNVLDYLGAMRLGSTLIFYRQTVGKIIGGSTQTSLRDSTDSFDNLLLTEAGAGTFRDTATATRLISTIATGTAPLTVASTTKVTNLNADLLDGLSSADFATSTPQYVTLATSADLTNERVLTPESSVLSLTDAGAGSTVTVGIATNGVGNTKLRQSAGLSVVGRSANTTGDVADITAASDGHVLRRSGTTLAFGLVDLSVSVTGALATGTVPLTQVTAGTSPAGTFTFPTLAATTRLTSPLIGTTTNVDVVFDRNSVTQLTLGSLAATFAGTVQGTTLTGTTRLTSPLIGTTTNVNVVFDRNSVTQLTLASLAATFAGTCTATEFLASTLDSGSATDLLLQRNNVTKLTLGNALATFADAVTVPNSITTTANGLIVNTPVNGNGLHFQDTGVNRAIFRLGASANTLDLSLRDTGGTAIDTGLSITIASGGGAVWTRRQTAPRFIGNGAAHVAGDYALSAGWGTTASVSGVAAKDTGGRVSITCNGASIAANPTVTLTFKDGTWTNAPGVTPARGDINAPTAAYWAQTTSSATAPVFTFFGTPVAGTVYVLDFNVIGR